MGKKLRDKLDHLKPKFIDGGMKNGYPKETLEKIWADWEKFASYAFNKSHATCYSWVAYQTAYLKANYPSEYMAATMSRNISNITEITKLMDECKQTGIPTLGPDINESYLKFSVNHKGNGPYKDIFDFVQRVNLSACNRKNIECMALAGVFDSFEGIKREDFFEKNSKGETFSDVLVRYGNKYQMDKAATAVSLFGAFDDVAVATPEIPNAPEWSSLERLNKERELVGIYLSAHPLDEYYVILNDVCNITHLHDSDVTMGGIVTSLREGLTKRGNPFGTAKVEDYSGSHEFTFYDKDWIEKKNYFVPGMFLYMKGRCQAKRWNKEEYEIVINKIDLLSDIKDSIIEKLTISMPVSSITEDFIAELMDNVDKNPGKVDLYFQIYDDDHETNVMLTSRKKKISVQRKIIDFLSDKPSINYKIN